MRKFSKLFENDKSCEIRRSRSSKTTSSRPGSNYLKNTKSFKIFLKSQLSKEDIFNIYQFGKKNKIKIFSTFDKKI